MYNFLRRNSTKVIVTAVCAAQGVPLVSDWLRNGGVIFAAEKVHERSDGPSGAEGIRHDLIESVPRLKKTGRRQLGQRRVSPRLDDLTLKNVHVFFRHGARTPIKPSVMPQVTWDKTVLQRGVPVTQIRYNLRYLDGTHWIDSGRDERRYRQYLFEGGIFGGQLTDIGAQQMYEVGVECRKRYVEEQKLLPEGYRKEFVYARSTNIVRTIESTKCVLAGIFGKKSLDAAIPEIIVAKDDDETLFVPNVNSCMVAMEMSKKMIVRCEFVEEAKKLATKVLARLGVETTGENTSTRLVLNTLRDEILCRQTHGLPIPESINDLVPEILEAGTVLETMFYFGTKEDEERSHLINAGPIFHMILKNMDSVAENKNRMKIQLYGVHDTTLVPMLTAMKAYDGDWPTYGSSLSYELYEDREGEHWVRILYENKEITLPDCEGRVCHLEQFRNAVSHLSITFNELQIICKGQVPLSLQDRLQD